MILGNGDIASVLTDRPDLVYMASGCSNSQNVTYADFIRERELILQYQNNHIVYFSSLCIYYSDSTYAQYKRDMEYLIQKVCESYTIVRIGNITWGSNPNTLLNYLKAHPEAERRDETRYLVDKDEFLHWIGKIKTGTKDIMNITGKMINVKNIEL